MTKQSATPVLPRMNRDEFQRWTAETGHHAERVDGLVIAMAPDPAVHNRVTANIHLELKTAIRLRLDPPGITVAVQAFYAV